jgi:hypothetical protein
MQENRSDRKLEPIAQMPHAARVERLIYASRGV